MLLTTTLISSKDYDALLALVRLGIGNAGVLFPDSLNFNWEVIKPLAAQQGLSAIVLDGIDYLTESKRPPKEFLLEWIGEVLQHYEQRYAQYQKAIAEMAGFYNSHGYKLMVLKGYACCLDWPNPAHRPCGDIDIWQFGKQKEADAVLTKEKGIKIDKSHQHHTVYYWKGFMVENHYDFINVHHHESNVEYEKLLKEFAKNDEHTVDVYGEKVYLPSPNLHALFLLKHIMAHFAAEEISLRQLLDWGFFVKKHGKEVDWVLVTYILDKYGMSSLYNVFNAICVENLGFESGIFWQVQFSPKLKERVLKEILEPEFGSVLPSGFTKRILFKYRRWRGSTWKHQLCYKESMRSAFWSGVWNHLLKPSSI